MNYSAITTRNALSADIRAIIANRQFWADCQHLVTVLHPLMAVIGILEAHSATLADCYQQLLTLAAAMYPSKHGYIMPTLKQCFKNDVH